MINAIFATDVNGGMGYNGTLPWPSNPHDMKWFQDLTMGHIVVMGRKTWDDAKFPKPLPGRICYVLTNRKETLPIYGRGITGDTQKTVLEIEKENPDRKIFVIGGPKILMECQPLYDYIYLTTFKGSYRCDTRIQVKEILAGFQVKRCDTSPDFQCSFLKYESLFKRPPASS
jgi:dihydrofolate reductase